MHTPEEQTREFALHFLMSSWLQSFEYRVTISWEVFALAGSLSLLIALATISYQAIKTAWPMHAETLKHE